MIVDSSAMIAVLLREPGWDELVDLLIDADRVAIGAPTVIEFGMVLTSRLGRVGTSLAGRALQEFDVEVVPVGKDHWPVALAAFAKYGKGRHPAGLNYGDCLTYAVAALAHEPLLCVGDDFPQTDLPLVKRL